MLRSESAGRSRLDASALGVIIHAAGESMPPIPKPEGASKSEQDDKLNGKK
jgi:hypothetical protein